MASVGHIHRPIRIRAVRHKDNETVSKNHVGILAEFFGELPHKRCDFRLFRIGKATEAISRQPEATDSIRGSLMIGLVFIETAIIYALIVAILVVFVL